MPRKPRMPKPGGMTSSVRNVSNSGQMSTSTHSTGATGAAINRTSIISNNGTGGSNGAQSHTVTSISPNVTWDGANVAISPNIGGSVSMPAPTRETVMGAYTQVEGELAQARSRALGMAPKEYHDQVNSAFDNAHTQIADSKKRLGW